MNTTATRFFWAALAIAKLATNSIDGDEALRDRVDFVFRAITLVTSYLLFSLYLSLYLFIALSLYRFVLCPFVLLCFCVSVFLCFCPEYAESMTRWHCLLSSSGAIPGTLPKLLFERGPETLLLHKLLHLYFLTGRVRKEEYADGYMDIFEQQRHPGWQVDGKALRHETGSVEMELFVE